MGALSALKKAKPLVSKFDEALANLQRPKGTGNEFLTEVMKQAGVKKAEVEDRKLRQAFEKAGKITKEQAQEIAQKHASPRIEERILTEHGDKFEELQKIAESEYGQPFKDLHPSIQDQIERDFDAVAAQYGEYRLPGGSNYREILLKLPSMPDAEKERLMQLEAKHRRLSEPAQWVFEESPEGQEMKALKDKANQSAYYSSHWGKGEPNVLAHMRVQDRAGPNGEKILHVEEIQSDWHQAGRKKGYQTLSEEEKSLLSQLMHQQDQLKEKRKKLHKAAEILPEGMEEDANRLVLQASDLSPQIISLQSKIDDLSKKTGAMPDAPFKKNWHELAMKRLINHAAENGYDKIAITPGAEQASRYDLSKHISKVRYFDDPNSDMGVLHAYDLEGNNILNQRMSKSELEDHIGKDAAEKLLAQQVEKNERTGYPSQKRTLSGLDLQVGGEGMKGFYDKMLPDYLNTLGKKHGTSVKQISFKIPNVEPWNIEDAAKFHGMTGTDYLDSPNRSLLEKQFLESRENKTTPLHTFDITPELREEVTTKGLPLYQQIGLPLGTGVGSYEFNAPEPEYAAGGAVNYNTDPDMSDGGEIIQGAPYKKGGKVRITDNLDEMFMEVNNKKFQRK